MSYSILRKLLFTLSPETAHDLSLEWLGALHRLRLLQPFVKSVPEQPVEVMGLRFPHPVGLAAGLDKNADYLDALGALGFGFVEVGTVTPRAQPGNPKPRMFRLEDERAIINRMGFNNKGLDHFLARVQKARFQGPIGINIGKNFDTPVESANEDYLKGLRAVYEHADYVTVNVSSPNTPGLRDLQFGDALNLLLDAIKEEQASLKQQHQRYVPIAMKIAPDMSEEDSRQVAKALASRDFDGVIVSNTTLDKSAVEASSFGAEAGGLSGAPLTKKSTDMVALMHAELGNNVPIIGVGGIMCGEDAADKLRAGAKLVQLYSGFIYRGPALIRECADAISTYKASL